MTDTHWPALNIADWQDTCTTLHLWTQIVGKTRLALAPHQNHWWQVALYVSPVGLTTSAMPFGDASRPETVSVSFNFIEHRLDVRTSDGRRAGFSLQPMSVATFYVRYRDTLASLGVEPDIWPVPSEIEDPIPFPQDETHHHYDAQQAYHFWRVLLAADGVMQAFRSDYLGKSSPVHFFWGSFDLAVTRFSGAPAPEHPGAPNIPDRVTREAYSHEVSSAGFWPGAVGVSEALFYAYAYPQPDDYADAPVQPEAARYDTDLGEFVLPYEAVRRAADPAAELMAFLRSTYTAAADTGGWPRDQLERSSAAVVD